jgi:hypothetical protein
MAAPYWVKVLHFQLEAAKSIVELLETENDLIAGYWVEHGAAPLWQFGN